MNRRKQQKEQSLFDQTENDFKTFCNKNEDNQKSLEKSIQNKITIEKSKITLDYIQLFKDIQKIEKELSTNELGTDFQTLIKSYKDGKKDFDKRLKTTFEREHVNDAKCFEMLCEENKVEDATRNICFENQHKINQMKMKKEFLKWKNSNTEIMKQLQKNEIQNEMIGVEIIQQKSYGKLKEIVFEIQFEDKNEIDLICIFDSDKIETEEESLIEGWKYIKLNENEIRNVLQLTVKIDSSMKTIIICCYPKDSLENRSFNKYHLN